MSSQILGGKNLKRNEDVGTRKSHGLGGSDTLSHVTGRLIARVCVSQTPLKFGSLFC